MALLIQLGGSQPCLWNGYASQGSSVITYGPGHEHFGAEPKEFACAFISISLERIQLLLERCHQAVVGRLQTGCHQLQAPMLRFLEIEKRLAQLQAVIDSKPALLAHSAIRQMLEHSLEESLLSIIHAAGQHLLHRPTNLGSNHPPNRTILGEPSRPADPFVTNLRSHRCQPRNARPRLS